MEPVTVDDPDDPRLADFRDLRGAEGPGRRESAADHFVVEGVLAVQRVLDGPRPLRAVLLTPSRAASLTELRAQLPPGVPVYVADRAVLARLTGFDVHRGVLASAQRLPLPDPAEVLGRCRRVAVVEAVNDLENLGAVFRVAAGLGIGAVLLDDRCADPLYRRCVRVSLGWSAVVPHARLGALPDGLAAVRDAGLRTVALTPATGAVAVDEAAGAGLLDDPVALLVGAEGPGLDPATIAACDQRVSIPMASGVDSLNVATALAVVAAFAAGRRGWRG